ncbi:hypothetical protein TH63_00910 [Rufibacter radiotolerans]|uniref:Lipoprotein n=1 Tax=Rufibacter radiotolerans TaxID=1379910 RepID=A0A0H4VGV4_9BACT|nr:hypothetical protein [Rufibacter radiotolerans]AKQ44513.1 hypothetical protein TH63_00910 [Rufibacter radiotolerans]
MKKQIKTCKRLAYTLLVGGALLTGTAACSTGTDKGEVNVEESDFKDKSPTEHNAEGTSDNTEDVKDERNPANQKIYDEQQEKMRNRNDSTQEQGFGAAAKTQNKKDQ